MGCCRSNGHHTVPEFPIAGEKRVRKSKRRLGTEENEDQSDEAHSESGNSPATAGLSVAFRGDKISQLTTKRERGLAMLRLQVERGGCSYPTADHNQTDAQIDYIERIHCVSGT
jgi:hypothetical protein